LWTGGLSIINFEGIFGPYLTSVRISLLLPSKWMENTTAENSC